MENKEKNSVSELMETTMTKIREMVDSNSVIGEPITTPDGVTLIPVSRVSLGFGSGGGTYGQTSERFGGGGGAGVKIDPVAFLVIKDGQTRMVPVAGDCDGGSRAGDGAAAHRPRRGLRQQEKGRERICVKAGILKSFCKKG